MNERQTVENSGEQAQTNEEKFAAFAGLTATLHTNAFSHFEEAMEGSGLETVEVPVTSVQLEAGHPVAFGVRASEISRNKKERGVRESTILGFLEMAPDRIRLFNIDGTETWPSSKLLIQEFVEPVASDSFDVSYI